jgi:hypothetical protein
MTANIETLPIATDAAAEPPHLTELQHTLRRLIAGRAHHQRLVAGISDRLARLDAVLRDDRELESTIRQLTLAHQGVLAAWIEGGRAGPEPRQPKELLDARSLHAQMQTDVAAAMGRMPTVQNEQLAAVEALRVAVSALDDARYACAAECCEPVAVRAAAAFRQGLSEIAKIDSVRAALRRCPEADTGAYRAACAIDTLVAEARAAGVPPAPQFGMGRARDRRFAWSSAHLS